MLYVGIDPGVSGGIAILDGGRPRVAQPMPSTDADVLYVLGQTGDGGEVFAIIEKVNLGFPGSNKASTAKLMGNFRACRMALTALGIPLEEVTAHCWQKGLGIPPRTKTESRTQFKNRLKAKAQQLFPSVAITLKTADALLTAEYCRRKHEGRL